MEVVTTYKAGKQMRVMVWASFWGKRERCPLFILERDFESKKHGYTADSYIQVFENRLLEYYYDGLIFMQDNAPIYMAPYSPDLNPIERAWRALKKMVQKMIPDLMSGTGKSEEDRTKLEEALKLAWEALPDDFFEKLVESMPARIEACNTANGWHTKY